MGVMHVGVMAGLLAAAACSEKRDIHRNDTRDAYHYEQGYRYEEGDRVDRNGHRDVNWCASHLDDEHCKP
jgi:hypothetical protein